MNRMITSRNVAALFAVAALAVACSSQSEEAGATGSGKCGPSLTTENTTCTQGELDGYSQCKTSQCGSEINACKSPCQAQTECVNACACGDTACISKCTPSADCKTCLQSAATCAVSKCPAPACVSKKPAAGDAGTTPATGDAGTGGPPAPRPDAGTSAGGSCAELKTCCDAIPASDADKDLCNLTVGDGFASTCASELAYYRSHGKC